MKRTATSEPQTTRETIAELFEEHPPVLVEARFPGTSPDWYLFDREEQWDALLAKLGPAVELRVNSVWDLTNDKGEVVVKRGELTKDRE